MPEPAPQGTPEEKTHRAATASPPPRPSRGARSAQPRRSGRWVWLLAAVLAGIAVYLTWQTTQLQSRNQALTAELSATRAELSAARAELGAYRAHLAGARERAADLRGQFEELEGFLARDPTRPGPGE